MIIQKQTNLKQKVTIVASLGALVAIVAIVFGVLTSQSNAKSSSATNKATVQQSDFAFATDKAEDWRQGPSNGTSLALFSNDRTCFVSLEHRNGAVNIAAELQKIESQFVKGGYTAVRYIKKAAILRIGGESHQYQLYRYTVSGKGSGGQLYGGQEFGYVPLSNGYVFVQGYCNTVDQLPSTISALQAITVKDLK